MDFRPILVLVPALVFAFMNGANDSGTMAASVVSSRSIRPRTAMWIAAIASFAGAMLLGSEVARMLGERLLHLEYLPPGASPFWACVGAVFSAIGWGLFAWKFGLPASYTHALLGGWLGGFMALGGVQIVNVANVFYVLAAVLLTPFLALFVSWAGLLTMYYLLEEVSLQAMPLFRAIERVMFVLMSFAHGANAAQKSMALLVIAGLSLGRTGPLPVKFDLPLWVQGVCAASFAIGVLFGFVRTLKTVGFGIFRVGPLHSFCALASSAGLTIVSTVFGLPLSSGQINSSALLGAGAGHNIKAVRWDVAFEFFANWAVTFPASAGMSYVLVKVIK